MSFWPECRNTGSAPSGARVCSVRRLRMGAAALEPMQLLARRPVAGVYRPVSLGRQKVAGCLGTLHLCPYFFSLRRTFTKTLHERVAVSLVLARVAGPCSSTTAATSHPQKNQKPCMRVHCARSSSQSLTALNKGVSKVLGKP